MDTPLLPKDSDDFRPSPKKIFMILIGVIPAISVSILGSYFAVVFSLMVLPYLLISLLAIRSIQFLTYGDAYKIATQLKHLLRSWMFLASLIAECGMFLAQFLPKDTRFIYIFIEKGVGFFKGINYKFSPFGLSQKRYICLRCLFSFMVYLYTHDILTGLSSYNESILHVAQALTEIIDGLFLFWEEIVEITCSLFQLAESTTRPPTVDLTTTLVLLLMGYDFITLLTQVIVWLIRMISRKSPTKSSESYPPLCSPAAQTNVEAKSPLEVWNTLIAKLLYRRYLAYFANGILSNFFLIFNLVGIKWISMAGLLIFSIQKSIRAYIPAGNFGEWSFYILLICSILWFIKAIVLLEWEFHTLYDRLNSRILNVGEQLYFLGIISWRDNNIFNLPYVMPERTDGQENTNIPTEGIVKKIKHAIQDGFPVNVVVDFLQTSSLMSLYGVENKKKLTFKKRRKIRDDLFMKKQCEPTLDDVQQVAQYILDAQNHMLKETQACEIMKNIDPNNNNRDKLEDLITWKSLGASECSQGREWSNDWHHFVRELLKIEPSNLSCTDIHAWVVNAHDNVISMANTLSSAKEVTGGLNKVVNAILIGGSLIILLHASGFATTEELVLVASPFLAAAFLFKDTCKNLAERILFVYVIHPFDIGDRCVIDAKMMEVAAIGLWTTTFSATDKAGRHEAIIYPNSELANKTIIKHKPLVRILE